VIESVAIPVIRFGIVRHCDVDRQTALEPLVKIDQVRVNVVQERAVRPQAEGNAQAAAERFKQSSM
jgi:hypothetical protein